MALSGSPPFGPQKCSRGLACSISPPAIVASWSLAAMCPRQCNNASVLCRPAIQASPSYRPPLGPPAVQQGLACPVGSLSPCPRPPDGTKRDRSRYPALRDPAKTPLSSRFMRSATVFGYQRPPRGAVKPWDNSLSQMSRKLWPVSFRCSAKPCAVFVLYMIEPRSKS